MLWFSPVFCVYSYDHFLLCLLMLEIGILWMGVKMKIETICPLLRVNCKETTLTCKQNHYNKSFNWQLHSTLSLLCALISPITLLSHESSKRSTEIVDVSPSSKWRSQCTVRLSDLPRLAAGDLRAWTIHYYVLNLLTHWAFTIPS